MSAPRFVSVNVVPPVIVPEPIVDPRSVVVQFGNGVSATFEKVAFAVVPST
jgi:hypothetical protein